MRYHLLEATYITGYQNSDGNWKQSGNKSYLWLPLRVKGKFVYIWSNRNDQKAKFNHGDEKDAILLPSLEYWWVDGCLYMDIFLLIYIVYIFMTIEQLLTDLLKAYQDAKRWKRKTSAVMDFDYDYESSLILLATLLIDRIYKPTISLCFIYKDRIKREVFAADFRDRIIHHLFYNYIYEIVDKSFIYDSYSCRGR